MPPEKLEFQFNAKSMNENFEMPQKCRKRNWFMSCCLFTQYYVIMPAFSVNLFQKNSLTFFDNVDRNQITICLRPILINIKVMKCPFLDIKTWKNCPINHILCTIYLHMGLGPKKIVLLFRQFSSLSFSLLPITSP